MIWRLEETAQVGWSEGLHARAAGEIAEIAYGSECEIVLMVPGRPPASGKSPLRLMALGVKGGQEVKVIVTHPNSLYQVEETLTDVLLTLRGPAQPFEGVSQGCVFMRGKENYFLDSPLPFNFCFCLPSANGRGASGMYLGLHSRTFSEGVDVPDPWHSDIAMRIEGQLNQRVTNYVFGTFWGMDRPLILSSGRVSVDGPSEPMGPALEAALVHMGLSEDHPVKLVGHAALPLSDLRVRLVLEAGQRLALRT